MRKKVLKRIGICLISILVIAVVLFWGMIIRKHIIIQSIRNKIAKYQQSKDYYIHMISKMENDSSQVDFFRKGDLEVAQKYTNSENPNTVYYCRNLKTKKMDWYLDNGDSKIAILGQDYDEDIYGIFADYFAIQNKWNYLRFLVNVKIETKKYQGKNCYHINFKKCLNYMEDTLGGFLLEEGETIEDYKLELYIEKKTGLTIYNSILQKEYEYQFDCVKDENLEAPNIASYKAMYVSITEEDYQKYNEGNFSLRICGWGSGVYNGEETISLTLRVYKQIPDETLEGEVGRFLGTNTYFSLNLDPNMKCTWGNEERTLKEEYETRKQSGAMLQNDGDEGVLPLLNDQFIFENGKLVSIIFSTV